MVGAVAGGAGADGRGPARHAHHTLQAPLRRAGRAVSVEEAGRYLETFKLYEHKGADAIKGRVSNDYMTQVRLALPSCAAWPG